MTVALVLGAGGVIGRAYHVGTLAALAEAAGWEARSAGLIVGTSAGAGTGATLRLGLSVADHRARLTGADLSEEGEALVGGLSHHTEFDEPTPRGLAERRPQAPHLVFEGLRPPWPARVGVGLSGLLPRGNVPIGPLGEKLRLLYGDRWPDQPLWICSVRMRDGRRVVFGRDDPAPGSPGHPDLATAVEASSAIPGYFEPVAIADDQYLDGAAFSSTNADLTAGLGFDGVVVISPMSAVREALRWHPRSASRAAYHRILQREVDAVEAAGSPVLVFEPTREDLEHMGGSALDGGGESELVARAYRSAIDRLERLGITDLARSWGR